jgi:hypothetical protein
MLLGSVLAENVEAPATESMSACLNDIGGKLLCSAVTYMMTASLSARKEG